MTRHHCSRRLRSAQIEYSRAESDMRFAYFQATRRPAGLLEVHGPERRACVHESDHFESRELDGSIGREIRLFIRDGHESELRELIGAAAVTRWLEARAECDRLTADRRHYRVEESPHG